MQNLRKTCIFALKNTIKMSPIKPNNLKKFIGDAIKMLLTGEELQAISLAKLSTYCTRVGVTSEEVERYIAIKVSEGELTCTPVGHAYYIIPK